ncbi:MAG: hypothetical protein ACI4A5_01200 [Hominilimicola sp.]
MAMLSCIAFAENANILVNGDFENALLGAGNSWGFAQSGGWFAALDDGTGEINTDEYHGGTSSLKLSKATACQRITLDDSYKYTLTAYVNERYNSLADCYDEAKANLDEVNKKIADKLAKKETMEMFMKNLKKQSGVVTEFDESLWLSMVDYVTVNSEEDIQVTFKNGSSMRL